MPASGFGVGVSDAAHESGCVDLQYRTDRTAMPTRMRSRPTRKRWSLVVRRVAGGRVDMVYRIVVAVGRLMVSIAVTTDGDMKPIFSCPCSADLVL